METDTNIILIIEDDPGLLRGYVRNLTAQEYKIDAVQEMDQARQLMADTEYAVILTDLKLHTSDEGGLEILSEVKKLHPDTQVIIFSGVGDTQAVTRAFRLSANAYLTKPLDFPHVRERILYHISVYRWQKSVRDDAPPTMPPLASHLDQTPEPYYFYAEPMKRLVSRAKRVYRTSENILITGEAGAGKSLLAEGIHRGSGRSAFELVNCAGLSDITLEPLLFGSVADDGIYRPGLLERLQGGTLVLDRITGIGPALQERLLSVLNAKEFFPMPGANPVKVDLRIISIDDGYLKDDVERQLFSEELYNHLSRAHLHVPPLRERYDENYRDSIILAQQFISQKYKATNPLDPETEYVIEQYPFPGNVAELDRIVRQALGSVKQGEAILPKHLPTRMLRYGVRPGLGMVEAGIRVLCPHGPFTCDRTATIATAHRSITGVYLRLSHDLSSHVFAQLSQFIRQLGMTPLLAESIPDAQTEMCSTCIPVQSGHYAVIDVSDNTSDFLYDVGLLHALGTPTLLLCHVLANQPARLGDTGLIRYEDPEKLPVYVHNWLKGFLS